MFGKPDPSALDQLIARVVSDMETTDPQTDEYQNLLTKLERLTKLKEPKRAKFSPDTLVTVGGNILGVLIIVMYEQKHVMTSKAFPLPFKNR